MMLGRWMAQMGEAGRSAYWINRAASAQPGDRDMQRAFCQELVHLWARERALACLEDFLGTYPDDNEATQYVAILTRNLELGLRNARDAVAQNPTFWYRRYQLADWLVVAGLWEETIDTLKPVAPQVFDDPPAVNDFTTWAVRNAGQALLALGERERAEKMLEAGLEYIERRRKLQASGYIAGIEDAQYLLILGRTEEGLARLQEAVDDGWRYYSFLLNEAVFDPYRDDPRFQEAYRTVEEDLAEQLAWFDANKDKPMVEVKL
jgi:tetratricopeptide (TPR) repeat protein